MGRDQKENSSIIIRGEKGLQAKNTPSSGLSTMGHRHLVDKPFFLKTRISS